MGAPEEVLRRSSREVLEKVVGAPEEVLSGSSREVLEEVVGGPEDQPVYFLEEVVGGPEEVLSEVLEEVMGGPRGRSCRRSWEVLRRPSREVLEEVVEGPEEVVRVRLTTGEVLITRISWGGRSWQLGSPHGRSYGQDF